MPRVEVLYLEGCPGYEALLSLLCDLVGERAEVELHRIGSTEEAEAQRFLGSPTVRIDGADIEPGAGQRSDFGMKCRLYHAAGGQSHTPPERWIRDAIEAAR